MNASNLIEALRPWLDEKIGAKLDLIGSEPIPVLRLRKERQVRYSRQGLVSVALSQHNRKWLEPLKPIVANLTLGGVVLNIRWV